MREAIHRNSTTDAVAAWCKELGFHDAEVVGRWVWIFFDEKPGPATRNRLKRNPDGTATGFRWVKRRQGWAHCCGRRSRKGKGDPREKYEVTAVDEYDTERAA